MMSKGYSLQSAVPNTLTLLPTYQCTAECVDCCFGSSPRITKRIPQDHLLQYIDEAAQFPGMMLIVVSGGEPFLLRRDLVELVQRITDRGLLSRVVTNGYWGVNERGALDVIRPLVLAGLREVSFSTGDDHAKFVPLDRVLTAINACLYCGVGVSLMLEEREGRTITRATVLEAAKAFPEVLNAIKTRALLILESSWMKFTDDPAEPTWNPLAMANAATLPRRQSCGSVLSSIVVTPDEKLGMCCGLPRESISDLNVGDLRSESMTSLYARHVHDILKIWLAVEGPDRILAWAASKDPSIEWENKYAHLCDSCRAVYADPRVTDAINKYGSEKFDELLSVFATRSVPFASESPNVPPVSRSSVSLDLASVSPAALYRRQPDGLITQVPSGS